MADYWFDANIFIESKSRAYAYDLAPGFWHWIQKITTDGKMRVPKMVWDEVCKGERDQVARWLQAMNPKPVVTADSGVTKLQGDIGDWIFGNYPLPKAQQFMQGGDTWLIAHAGCSKGTVVTYEGPGFGTGGKIQVPEICNQFAIQHTNLYAAARKLGLKLVLPGFDEEERT